jgi:hypothetical protein
VAVRSTEAANCSHVALQTLRLSACALLQRLAAVTAACRTCCQSGQAQLGARWAQTCQAREAADWQLLGEVGCAGAVLSALLQQTLWLCVFAVHRGGRSSQTHSDSTVVYAMHAYNSWLMTEPRSQDCMLQQHYVPQKPVASTACALQLAVAPLHIQPLAVGSLSW